MRLSARVGIVLFLFLPYFVFIWRIDSWVLPSVLELESVLIYTVAQAVLSACFGLFLGLWSALGLCYAFSNFSLRNFRLIEAAVLLPNFLPNLFVVISLLGIIRSFPFGLIGIVFVHSLIYSGFVATIFFAKFNQRLGGMLELVAIEGASFLQVMGSLVLPAVKKDLINTFILLFLISFNSFSVPMLVGIAGSPSIEILSYQKIVIEGNLPQAFGLASLQIIFSIIIFALPISPIFRRSSRMSNLSVLGSISGLIAIFVIMFLCSLGLILELPKGISEIWGNENLIKGLLVPVAGTVLIGFSVGSICFAGLSLVAYGLPQKYFHKLLTSYVAPSTVMVGFGFLLLPNRGVFFAPLAIIFGLVMLLLPALYRSSLSEGVASLEKQLDIANVLGAPWRLTFWNIVFPQVGQDIGILSGYAAFWAVGDFALSRIVSGRDITLGLVIDGLLGSYRLASSSVLSAVLVIIGVGLFLLFKEVGNVLSQKSHTPI